MSFSHCRSRDDVQADPATGNWRSRRLSLCPASERFADDVRALIADPRVRKWLRPGRVSTSVQAASAPHFQRFAVHGALDHEFVGMCCFVGHRLSYAVVPEAWGRGFGAEIVQAGCELIAPTLGLHWIEAQVERANVRSRRLLESSGFTWRGTSTSAAPPVIEVLVYSRQLVVHPGIASPELTATQA